MATNRTAPGHTHMGIVVSIGWNLGANLPLVVVNGHYGHVERVNQCDRVRWGQATGELHTTQLSYQG